ncbi:adenosine kinase [Nannochloropsis gaditana]|uniref:Adenosine kinase n=1 Tax=Nannochloropsis gaditana TaxID=72520 RepID=W7T2T9_9STRA|nr:adenosine kinase [Nannochloropsis gaditana]
MPTILLGMGNPLLDISAEVPQEVLDKYELKLDSAILAEEKHLPLYKELVDAYKVQYIAGGATQNAIRVAQWMSQTPGSTSFFGCIGKDDFGAELQNCAKADGVNAFYKEDPETPTGTCAVLVKDGERSLCANLAAANKFTADHLASVKAKEMIAEAKMFYIASFFLTVSVESLLVVADHAVEHNKIFAMNLSAPFLIQFFAEPMAQALPYTDYVFGNESEATAYGELQGWGTDIPTIALRLAAAPKKSGTRPRVVVFTQGSEATVVAKEGQVEKFPVEMLEKDKLVDTNGAGDAFVGGFLSVLMRKEGAAMEECVRAGHWASRVIIQRSGCTFPKECDYK